ncbi:MAG: ankyrin repeat domain-containing protein [Burkholderiaceae bacterium]
MRNYFKYWTLCIVSIGFFSANAGSYEDFFAAIRKDDAQTITSLIQRGFEPNTPDPDGLHPLMLAVQLDSLKAARALAVAPRMRLDARNPHDETPLMLASLRGHTELARELIARQADVNKTGWTPLHYAATRGHLDIMRMLLEAHAYIDAESPNGTTPLMMAAHYGTPQAVRLLLDEGADPTLKNQLGLSAIDFAQRANRADVAAAIAAAIRQRSGKGTW